jgi:glycosyltransferase involved in cell wall biosynthesis
MESNEYNAKGYWENNLLVSLNDELLARLGGSWHTPPQLQPGWEKCKQLADLRQSARDILQKDFGNSKLWGWKDPRTCLTLPFWQNLLPEMYYVLCLRNPLDVAKSLERRDGFPLEKGLSLFFTYLTSALQYTSGKARLFVFYEDVMDDWLTQATRLARFIGHPQPADDETTRKSLEDFIEKNLQHHHTSLLDTTDEPRLSFPAKALYWVLRASAHAEQSSPHQESEHLTFQKAIDVFSDYALEAQRNEEKLTQLVTAHHAQEQELGRLAQELQELRQLYAQRQQEQETALAQAKREREELQGKYQQLVDLYGERQKEVERLAQELQQLHQLYAHRPQEQETALAQAKREREELQGKYQQLAELYGERQKEVERLGQELQSICSTKWFRLASTYWAIHERLRRGKQGRAEASVNLGQEDYQRLIRRSKLFDAKWYLRNNPDVGRAGIDPAWHYLHQGWKENRDPSPHFSTKWYRETYLPNQEINPLVHYLLRGRDEGHAPKPPAEPSATTTQPLTPPPGLHTLLRIQAKFRRHGWSWVLSALRNFIHRKNYEVTLADIRRNISTAENSSWREQYLHQLSVAMKKQHSDYIDDDDTLDLSKTSHPVKLIAFYLPQFHPIPENDLWWGKGFTEWTNVTKAVPQFVGHYQPHLPGELGFYDLRLPDVLRRQAQLAKKYGIYGFCFYYYWFDGKTLLDLPLNTFSADKGIDLPFCLCWANENWTRRWDGLDQEILLAQNHSLEGDIRFIEKIIPYLHNPRYIRIEGRPLLLVYKAHHLSNPPEVAARWRQLCRSAGIGDLFLVAAEAFGFDYHPGDLGFDAVVEFPPHLPLNSQEIPAITDTFRLLNPDFAGAIYDYESAASYLLGRKKPPYERFRTVMLSWDNTARRPHNPTIFTNFSLTKYEAWLAKACNETLQEKNSERRIVFINAWNEWAEGTHLEPDRRYGYGYLRATANALLSLPTQKQPKKASWNILFVSHDLRRAGAQLVLLELIRWLRTHTDIHIALVSLAGGELSPEFSALLPVAVLSPPYSPSQVQEKVHELLGGPPDIIYGNTVVAGKLYPFLKDLGVPIVTHVHELESSIRHYAQSQMAHVLDKTNHFICVSEPVRQYLHTAYGVPPNDSSVIPAFIRIQNFTTTPQINRTILRKEIGMPPDSFIVVGCGLGMPFRKGADLFIRVASNLRAQGITSFHFYWIGKFDEHFTDPVFGSWVEKKRELFRPELKNCLTFLGFKKDPRPFLHASDVFLLTSREDPYPLVMLEAAECGLPIICFADSGGAPDFVRDDAGFVVPYEDVGAMAEKIVTLMRDEPLRSRLGRNARQRVLAHATPDRVCPRILSVVRRHAKKDPRVTIIVPNYNHARYLPKRLESIFYQSFRDFEVILLDDASSDDSVSILQSYANFPDVRLLVNHSNSGSPFKQWVKALEMATGDLVWIAESDDLSDLTFLETLLAPFEDPSVKLAYCASRIIDEHGNIGGDYIQTDYLRSLSPIKWQASYCIPADQEVNDALGIKNTVINISACLFRKPRLNPEISNMLSTMRFAGDWLFILYLIRGGKIFYSEKRLNYHRRHERSIFGKLLSEKDGQLVDIFLNEYSTCVKYAIETFHLSDDYLVRLKEYLEELWNTFCPTAPANEFQKYFNLPKLWQAD